MKIAVNTRFLLSNKMEGIGWVSFELLKRMVAAHPEDEFLFFFDRAYDEKFIFGNNVTPVVLSPPARHPFLWYWWFEISIHQALKKYQPDIFLSTDGYLSLATSIKTVMITHDIAHVHFPEQIPFLVRSYYNHFVPKFLERADRIVTVSEFTKQDIIRQYAIDEKKITVVHNACQDEFKPVDKKTKEQIRDQYTSGQPYFLFVGAVHPRKNVHRLIEAFDQFKSTTKAAHKLLIVGRFAWQTGAVKTAFDNSRYQQDIIFPGYVDDLYSITASAFAMVYVSLFEGFGLPVLEAMNCEVPVITSNISSLPEVAGDGGLLVDPTSVSEIANAMQELLVDQELYKRLINRSRQRCLQFSWDESAAKLYAILQKAL